MKKILFITSAITALILCCGQGFAQNRFPPINLYTGDPTGVSCTVPNSIVQSSTTGAMSSCVGGVYVTPASGVWSVTGTAPVVCTTSGSGVNCTMPYPPCIAAAQGTGQAGTDIAACEAIIASGGTIDARGYTSYSVINGLRISKPLTLLLGPGPFDATGIIDAHDTGGVHIVCYDTEIYGDTGAGKPVIDAMGTHDFNMEGCNAPGIMPGVGSSPSTIGILQARTTLNTNPERSHLKDTSIQLAGNPAANGGCGTFGIYNYGAEIAEYDHVHVIADRPMVLTRTNAWPSYAPAPVHESCGVTAPDIPFYGGIVTMNAVQITGKSDLYSGYEAMILDGAGTINADFGEVDGTDVVGNYAISAWGNTNNITINGEWEHYSRIAYIDGSMVSSRLDLTCGGCGTDGFSGTLTTSTGSATATPSTMVGLSPGQMITNINVPRGTLINTVGASTITMSTGVGVVAGTASATTGEPVITLNGGDVENTDFKVFVGGTGPEFNYIQALSATSSATGWTAWVPINGDISWVSTLPVHGTCLFPYGSGLPNPLLTAGVCSDGNNNNGSWVTGTNPISGSTGTFIGPLTIGTSGSASGGLLNFVGQSSLSNDWKCTTRLMAGLECTNSGSGVIQFPDSGGLVVPGAQGFQGVYSPSTTPGLYLSTYTTADGQYFTNSLAGDWILYSHLNRIDIGAGGGYKAAVIVGPNTLTVPQNFILPAQESLSGENCLQVDSSGNVTNTGSACAGNLPGGSAYTIPYQTAPNTTAMLAGPTAAPSTVYALTETTNAHSVPDTPPAYQTGAALIAGQAIAPSTVSATVGYSGTGTATFTAGPGAGSGGSFVAPACSTGDGIVCDSVSGQGVFTTGNSPAAGANLVFVTLGGVTRTNKPVCPMNLLVDASGLNVPLNYGVGVSTTTLNLFIGAVALAANTTYDFNYICMGK